MTDPGPEDIKHPTLNPIEDARERGGDPVPPRRGVVPAAPNYKSDPHRRERLNDILPSIIRSRRYRQDLLLPYLLIRSAPGDHGKRPNQNLPLNESPDVMVVPGTPAQVASPDGAQFTNRVTAGQPHTVFVRVWNLGLLAAIGVRLTVHESYLEGAPPAIVRRPGLPGPLLTMTPPPTPTPPALIAQRYLDLADCYNPRCRGVFKLDTAWTPRTSASLVKIYLYARVSCFADQASNSFDARTERHVAVRGIIS